MLRLPIRNPRYQQGSSTPRPIRYNDALFADFAAVCARHGSTANEGLRLLMERAIAMDKRIRRRKRKEADAEADLEIVLELD